MSSTTPPAAGSVTMFTTTWCGYCQRLKKQMTDAGVDFTEVNIEEDPTAATFVETANNGNQTVPTLLFPDGSTATNPSLAQVQAQLVGNNS
ncbi:MAG TPA: mycoredoxin [Actinomycetaceae bacterium]|nr:mycoredoxin [Actinomycetaceae bacterium]